MKLLLLADGSAGAKIAQYLVSNHAADLAAVITTADNEISELCRLARIATFQFVSEAATLDRLHGRDVDLGLLAWWPKLIRKRLIAFPKLGFINTHPSLLPYNRGKHYNFWALVERAPFGVTLHKVTEDVDAGDIVAQRPIPYDWTDNGETLYRKAQDSWSSYSLTLTPSCARGLLKSSRSSFPKDRFTALRNSTKRAALSLISLRGARPSKPAPGEDLYRASWLLVRGRRLDLRGPHSYHENIEMSAYENFKQECRADIARMSSNDQLQDASRGWMNEANAHRYSYHFEWLGRPIIQYPQDIVAFQEVVWEVKPDLIIETGIAHGGSLILSASILALIDYCEAAEAGVALDPAKPKRTVLGVDIDIRAHNRAAIDAHPLRSRIDMIQGSSIAAEVAEKVRECAKGKKRVLVSLDSNHTHDHVLEELKLYAPLVTAGSYCIVFDTIIEDLPEGVFPDRPWGKGNNPKTAVWEFLKSHEEFAIDRSVQEKLLITVAPDGFLKRLR